MYITGKPDEMFLVRSIIVFGYVVSLNHRSRRINFVKFLIFNRLNKPELYKASSHLLDLIEVHRLLLVFLHTWLTEHHIVSLIPMESNN